MASRTFLSIALCLAAALAVASTFLAAAWLSRAYTELDLAVGFLWFFSVSFIASMPLLIPRVKRAGR